MKKIIALLLVLSIAGFAFAACSNDQTDIPENSDDATASDETAEDEMVMNFLEGSEMPPESMSVQASDVGMCLHFLYPAIGMENLIYEYAGTLTFDDEESIVLNAYVNIDGKNLLIAKGAKAVNGGVVYHHFDVARGSWSDVIISNGVYIPADSSLRFASELLYSFYNPVDKYSVRHPNPDNHATTFDYETGTFEIECEGYDVALRAFPVSDKKGEELAKELVAALPEYMSVTDTEFVKFGDKVKTKYAEFDQIFFKAKRNDKELEAGIIYCTEKNGKVYCFAAAVSNGLDNKYGIALDILNSVYFEK